MAKNLHGSEICCTFAVAFGRAVCLRLEDCVGIYSSANVATGHSDSGDPTALHMSLRSTYQLSRGGLTYAQSGLPNEKEKYNKY